ncbi:MAG TPA: cupin domain-containing protein [Longimicrobiaceae bacterium]|nr:cupin domain-containing protein [Longimicrobiaceae bacterium]
MTTGRRVAAARGVVYIHRPNLETSEWGLPMPTESGAQWFRWEEMPREQVTDQLSRRLITGERMMLAHVYLDKGCIVPKHSHENEQLTYILEGALRFWIGEDEAEEIVVRAGEVLHIPSNVPHKAEALEDTLDVDVFSPPRQDWLDRTDDYFHRK